MTDENRNAGQGAAGSMGASSRPGRNPYIGETAADTIANCHDGLEWLIVGGEELPRGLQLNHQALREALGSLMVGRPGGS